MARASRPSSAPALAPDAAAAVAPAADEASNAAVDAARACLARPLDVAQDAVHAMLSWQAWQAKVMGSWVQSVDDAVHQTRSARDLPGLGAVLLGLQQRQLALASSQWTEGWAQWWHSEVQLAEQLHSEGATLVQDLQPRDAAAAQRETGAAWLASWAHAQEQWRAMTQRWVDATLVQGGAERGS